MFEKTIFDPNIAEELGCADKAILVEFLYSNGNSFSISQNQMNAIIPWASRSKLRRHLKYLRDKSIIIGTENNGLGRRLAYTVNEIWYRKNSLGAKKYV